jgi:DNA replication and repair protein RecF
VRIHTLEAEGFRNLGTLRLEPHERFNIFEGQNGQGKTNILEAIYLLGALRSFRDSRVSALVGRDAASAVVRGGIEIRGIQRKLAVELSGNTRRAALDGKEVSRLSDYFGHLHVVVFAPDDLALTKGAASGRRRFLDRAIFNLEPSYLDESRDYLRALKHRNDLLRRGSSDAALLESFTETLVGHGARILSRRLMFLRDFEPLFREVFEEITGGEHEATMAYQSGVLTQAQVDPVPSLDELSERFRERLIAKRQVEARRGHTVLGPHADDLVLDLDGYAARSHASQGQHRSFALALKIAELRSIREAIGTEPVLLLDDVSSELDEARNAALMAHLDAAGGQVFITTTDRRWIQLQGQTQIYTVDRGLLSR